MFDLNKHLSYCSLFFLDLNVAFLLFSLLDCLIHSLSLFLRIFFSFILFFCIQMYWNQWLTLFLSSFLTFINPFQPLLFLQCHRFSFDIILIVLISSRLFWCIPSFCLLCLGPLNRLAKLSNVKRCCLNLSLFLLNCLLHTSH